MRAVVTDAGIVSAPALPYTEPERVSCSLNGEGAHFCNQKSCVNQATEED
jgi:hypothetical protein